MIPIPRLDSANLGAFWAKIFPSRSRLRRSRNSSSAELSGCPMAAQWLPSGSWSWWMVICEFGIFMEFWSRNNLRMLEMNGVDSQDAYVAAASLFLTSPYDWLPQGASGMREWVSVWRNCFTTFAVGCLTYLPLLSTSFVPAHVLTPIIHARKGFHHSSGKLSISAQTWKNTKKHQQLDSMLTRCNPQHVPINRFSRFFVPSSNSWRREMARGLCLVEAKYACGMTGITEMF